MVDSKINSLKDLNSFRSAPELNESQKAKLSLELSKYIEEGNWFTVGIMAKSGSIAISVLREIETYFNWSKMKLVNGLNQNGPVYLKANQNTGDIHIRIEHGLGEGILLGCHSINDEQNVDVLGPLPLNFFCSKN